jgi:hypothetical protein
MKIWYYRKLGGELLGSVNRLKIEALAKMNFAKVESCDITEFNGQLVNGDWDG